MLNSSFSIASFLLMKFLINLFFRWSEKVAVKLTDFMSGSIAFENILSIRVLEWLVILVGYKIKGINKLEARESKNSFFWLCTL